jgi:hypothetical protein
MTERRGEIRGRSARAVPVGIGRVLLGRASFPAYPAFPQAWPEAEVPLEENP